VQPVESGPTLREKHVQLTYFTLVSCLTLKMEATCFTEMSVDFQWTTWRHIPEERSLHNHRWETQILWLLGYSKHCFINRCSKLCNEMKGCLWMVD
jgi:hypothetical protein